MNEIDAPHADPAGALAREAAAWFARMRGPHGDADQAELEAWLAQGAAHRTAYNRAAEIFAMGKLLADEAEVASMPAASARPRRRTEQFALAAALVCLFVASWALLRPTDPATSSGIAATQVRDLATLAGETRTARLADGSTITLGEDGALEVRLDANRRLLHLVRGRARFEVAHDPRPFTVLAGGGSVTARGTVFEVELARAERVEVRLIEGAVDVALPRPAEAPARVVRRLAPGEHVSFAARAAASLPVGAPTPRPDLARDYSGVTLAALVAEANRGAARPIRLAGASLGAERVSGRFRVDDTGLLAERLAALFDARVDASDPGEIVLTR